MMAGNLESARAAGHKTADLVAPIAGEIVMLQPFALQEVLALLRFERLDEVLAQPAPPAGRDLQPSLHHYTRGAAFAGKGQAAEAERGTRGLDASAARLTNEVMYSTINPAPFVLDVARLDLTARIADLRGGGAEPWRRGGARPRLRTRLGTDEPPDGFAGPRETGRGADATGMAAEAEKVYRADLVKNRKNPRSLFGLWKSLERLGKSAEAVRAKADFEAAWSGADDALAESALGKSSSVAAVPRAIMILYPLFVIVP